MQINAIWLYYNELSFICCILLLAALIVFYRFTGLSYGDVCKLTTNEFKCEGNDVWLITKRNKTGTDVRLPLMDVPLRIFNKYVENRVSERIFPLMSNQKVNDYLKEIAAICGIEQRVTFHLARHLSFLF